jgi:asparagine synthase (glutamine-hydrolysing)
MCGIAGIVDICGGNHIPSDAVERMIAAIRHRGPDEQSVLRRPGIHLGAARLAIVDIAGGRQPMSNAQGSVWTVYNGEMFDHVEVRNRLQARGHVFRTQSDTELLPHLWEEFGENMLEHVTGQFAFALWDSRNDTVLLARDRIGICPLFWTVQAHQNGAGAKTRLLLFASEIKALLASGLVHTAPDHVGINHVFSFFAQPGPTTSFAGIRALPPGHYLRIERRSKNVEVPASRSYWSINFPDQGDEIDPPEQQVINRFESLFLDAVGKRLRADVPVVSYLSGGVDSGLVAAVASKLLNQSPLRTFSVSVKATGLDEGAKALGTAAAIGAAPVVVPFNKENLINLYPDLIWAAEAPVIDAAAAATLKLARTVHDHGYKTALTGEGADETMAGYAWFKSFKLLSMLNIAGLPVAIAARRLGLKLMRMSLPSQATMRRTLELLGGPNPWLDIYGLMSLSKMRFYCEELRQTVALESPFEFLEAETPRLLRWHPFNRGLYTGMRIMLPGNLLSLKGDRPAMASSLETRYPFLDEKIVAFLAQLHPRWKLRGILRDKYAERLVAARWLPREIAWRKKTMFRAPLTVLQAGTLEGETWLDQVLSPPSLQKTGLFDAEAVATWRGRLPSMLPGLKRTAIELGLMAVASTQLLHHIYFGGGLADLPAFSANRPVLR